MFFKSDIGGFCLVFSGFICILDGLVDLERITGVPNLHTYPELFAREKSFLI
jgi:hypothetical protein